MTTHEISSRFGTDAGLDTIDDQGPSIQIVPGDIEQSLTLITASGVFDLGAQRSLPIIGYSPVTGFFYRPVGVSPTPSA